MLVNVKGFLAASVTFALVVTIVSALVGASDFGLADFGRGLIFGAVVIGISMLVNRFLLKSAITNFKTLSYSTSGTLVATYLLFAMVGPGKVSIGEFVLGLVVVIIYGIISAFVGSAAAKGKFG